MGRRSVRNLKDDVRNYFIKKSKNIWIQEILDSQFDSFFPDLDTFVIDHQITNKRLNNINSAKVEKFFYESVVNDVAVFKDSRILTQIRKELLKNEKLDAFDSKRNKNLKELLCELLLFCVEADRTSALQHILGWIKNISDKGNLEREIKAWNQKDKKSKSTKGFTFNSEALIRACEKNNFKMVKHFLEICFCDGKIKFTLHVDKFEEGLKEEKFSCKEWFYDNTKMLSGEFQQYTSGFLNYFRIFYARSTPAYLVARFQFSDEKGFLLKFSSQIKKKYPVLYL